MAMAHFAFDVGLGIKRQELLQPFIGPVPLVMMVGS
jgi:hypothetical protein